MSPPLLEVRDLGVRFPVGGGLRRRWLRAARAVSFSVRRGEILALVGESGSGKSTLARAIARLVQPCSGQLLLDGTDMLTKEPRQASKAYRQRVQLVFQDPFASLNPAHTILHAVARPLLLHGRATPAEVRDKSLALLEACGLRPADLYLDQHPHSLSGGQRQRVAIARALATDPDVLLADEPTSMLDVSIRTDVLRLLVRLRDERGLAQVLVTHDLAAARFVADRILVLYGGMLMELSDAETLVSDPLHPYAQLLMAAVPRAGGSLFAPLPAAPGSADVVDPGPGCPFAARCPEAHDRCRSETPSVHAVGERLVRCHLHEPAAGAGPG